jgi:hypothetical protein
MMVCDRVGVSAPAGATLAVGARPAFGAATQWSHWYCRSAGASTVEVAWGWGLGRTGLSIGEAML